MNKPIDTLQSMTGFGQAYGKVAGYRVRIDIKSVNHRYGEVFVKLPREWMFLDEPIRKAVLRHVARGRVELYITIDHDLSPSTNRQLLVDWSLLKQYVEVGKQLQEETGIEGKLSVQELLTIPELVQFTETTDSEQFTPAFMVLLEQALEQFIDMRLREGAQLQKDMAQRVNRLGQALLQIEQRSAEVAKLIQNRIRERIRELLEETIELDEQRIAMEAAIYADKADIAEEIIRLKSHFKQFNDLLHTSEPVGRKLDFLVQEIHRELNTIGSKAAQTEVVTQVIDMKSELERIREQVQNIQ